MFIYLTWIGADRAVRDDKHIKLYFLENKTYSKYLKPVVTLICLITFVLLSYYGMEPMERLRSNVQISPTLHLPMWYFYFAVPLGGILMSIRYTYKLIYLRSTNAKEGQVIEMDIAVLFGSMILFFMIECP